MTDPTAVQFLKRLHALPTSPGADNSKYFNDRDDSTTFLNKRMLDVFSLAKEFKSIPVNEIARLLESQLYEARLGAVSIMDFQARDKKSSPASRKQIFDLYIKRHERINNWDLVDRSAPYVVGGYLADKSRKILYKLAKSKNVWERRTAIVSTYFFIRQNDVGDTFAVAEMLVNDKHDSINKAVGSWVREAGKRDKERLIEFLDTHAATMPRVTLRYAIEKLDKRTRDVYMGAATRRVR